MHVQDANFDNIKYGVVMLKKFFNKIKQAQ